MFVASKQRGLSQSVLTLFTDVDELDGENDGHVTDQQFEDAIKTIIGATSGTWSVDARYLALKYPTAKRNTTAEERARVYYRFFYKDYQELEERGLSGKIVGLDSASQPQVITEATKNPFEYQIPQKFLDFYDGLRRWLESRQKTTKFCAMLVEADVNKEGFLSNLQIYQCFQRVGMNLSKKQVGQATYPLHQDKGGRFSYPELVEHIFGKKEWEKVKLVHGLSGVAMDGKAAGAKAEEPRLEVSKNLLLEAELKYQDLLQAEEAISRGACRLSEEEFMAAFKKCKIHVKMADEKALQSFFRIYSKDMHGTVSFERFFEHYQLTERLSSLQAMLEGHFTRDFETQVDANKALRAQRYSFEDTVYFLRRCKFELSLIAKHPGASQQAQRAGGR